jgi:hypothetical protein
LIDRARGAFFYPNFTPKLGVFSDIFGYFGIDENIAKTLENIGFSSVFKGFAFGGEGGI